MGIQIGAKVERVDGRQLSYGDFVDRYLKKNLPVVLTGLMDGWQACTDWVTADGCPNLRFFSDHFGKSMVQVTDCCNRDFADQKRVEMSVSEYVDYWLGTWTPLHADVFRSYSWSANVCGKKLWLLLPPSQCHLIFDRYLKCSVYDVHGDISEKKFPGFAKAIWWECTQEQNEIIFVPSGWYHQVHNLEDTISINHNWFNGYNLSWVWNLLVDDYTEAKEYIEDIREICDDFESICQRNLAANTGMNVYDFFVFITRFLLANLVLLRDLKNVESVASHLRSMAYYVLNNIRTIHSVALSMGSIETFAEENLNSCSEENRMAYSEVKRIMEEPDFHELHTALRMALKSAWERRHQDYTAEIMPIDLANLSDFKIGNPTALVKLIENAFPDRFNIPNGCNIGFP